MGRMRAAVPGLDCLLDTDRSVKHAWCIAAADKVAAQMHRADARAVAGGRRDTNGGICSARR